MHVGDVAEPDRRTVLVGNNQTAVLIGAKDLVVRLDHPGVHGTGKLTLGTICIRKSEGGADGIEAYAQLVEQRGIHLRAHRRPGAAPDKHLPHTFHLRELLREDGVRSVIDPGKGNGVGGERQNHDWRIRRVDLPVGRVAGKIRGKLAAGGIDGSLHVAPSTINVAVQIELQNDVCRAQLAGRGHLVDAGDAAKLALEGSRHGGSHGLGTRSWQARPHGDDWEFHLRQRRHRQKFERQHSRKKQSGGQQ